MSNRVDSQGSRMPVSPTLHQVEQGELAWLWCDKPTGFSTHAPDPLRPGLKEILAAHLHQELWVVHRLDKETSGMCLFAANAKTAESFFHLFEKHEVQKTYLFLTDREVAFEKQSHDSFIDRVAGKWTSTTKSAPNARTEFQKLKTFSGSTLWQAKPLSGKPHQIRLHAQDLGIPVLGDYEHGGSAHSRVFLHALAIEFQIQGVRHSFTTVQPWWADRGPLKGPIDTWREAFENRRRLFGRSRDEVLRWSDGEVPDWVVEAYGARLFFSHFSSSGKVGATEVTFDQLQALAKEYDREALFKPQPNREKNKGQLPELVSSSREAGWVALEEGVKYELRQDQGQSLGLFLDQRGNRLWTRQNSQGCAVLNLFCYTGGFSVNAALGGATRVHSVDVSRKYLEWTKRNFVLNDLDPYLHQFSAMDSQKYLAWALKKGLRFDLIICDPPTFGRSDSGVFQIEKDFRDLLGACFALLTEDGRVLFSSNYEKWSFQDWEDRLIDLGKGLPQRFEVERGPAFALDCEKDLVERAMKSFLLKRRS